MENPWKEKIQAGTWITTVGHLLGIMIGRQKGLRGRLWSINRVSIP